MRKPLWGVLEDIAWHSWSRLPYTLTGSQREMLRSGFACFMWKSIDRVIQIVTILLTAFRKDFRFHNFYIILSVLASRSRWCILLYMKFFLWVSPVYSSLLSGQQSRCLHFDNTDCWFIVHFYFICPFPWFESWWHEIDLLYVTVFCSNLHRSHWHISRRLPRTPEDSFFFIIYA